MKIDKEDLIKEHFAKHPLRTTKMLQSLVNSMDGRCRQLVLTNPNRPIDDYCKRCQNMFKKILEEDLNELNRMDK